MKTIHQTLLMALFFAVIDKSFAFKFSSEDKRWSSYQEHSVHSSFNQSASAKVMNELVVEVVALSVNDKIDAYKREITQEELNYLMMRFAEQGFRDHEIDRIINLAASLVMAQNGIESASRVMTPLKLVRDLRKEMSFYEGYEARCFYTTGKKLSDVLEKDSPQLDSSKILDANAREDLAPCADKYVVVGKCRGMGVLDALRARGN